MKHIAGNHGRGELKSLRPAQCCAVEKLARGLKNGGIQRLLNHAGRFNAKGFQCGSGVFRRNVCGTFAAANGGIDLEGRGSGNELAIVFNGFHEANECVGSLPSHKKPYEGSGLEKITAHALPRSS
jgi:hypothetical protein